MIHEGSEVNAKDCFMKDFESEIKLVKVRTFDQEEDVFSENRIDDENTYEWLTSREAAEYLKISVGTLLNLTSRGAVPFYKFGRRNRYLKSELRRLLLGQKRGV
jgi:excisionase family DNA binding protein